MIVFSDNDILKKLACCDLCGEFLAAFGVSIHDIFVLNTARPVLTSKRGRKGIDEASFNRLIGFLTDVQIIATSPDPAELLALTEQPTIDAGEAVLFSVAHQVKEALLVTGDKRSLESLAQSDDRVCKILAQKLAGKIVCFEQTIERIMDLFGFDAVRDKLVIGRECDRTLAIVLGSGLNASEASVREGLASYITNLRMHTSSLLIGS